MTEAQAERPLVQRAWDLQHTDPHDSHDLAQEALDRARATGDVRSQSWALLTIGYYHLRYGTNGDARATLQAAMGGFEQHDDLRGRILASNGLARVRMVDNDLGGALEVFRGNLEAGGDAITTLDRFHTLNGIALCYSAMGDASRAVAYLFEALGELRNINARPQLATLLSNLGFELVAVGDCEEAYRILMEGEAIAAELHHPRLQLNLRSTLAECLLQLGRAAEALPFAEAIMNDPEAPRPSSPEGSVYPIAAHVFSEVGNIRRAEEAVTVALAAARNHQSQAGMAAALLERGRLEMARGNRQAAVATLHEARERLDAKSSALIRCRILEQLAHALAEAGWHAEAYATHCEFFAAHEERVGLASRARYFALQIRSELDRMRIERDALREQALRDPLTGLYNRRYLDSVLGDLLAMSQRSGAALAVAMIDLDHFKDINDRDGHPFGDEVLRTLARIVTTGTRAGDIACRYGGEEFCLVMPHASAADAVIRLEQVLAELTAHTVRLVDVERRGITFSAGIASFPVAGTTRDSLLAAADAALYDAKRAGRARVLSV